MKSIDTKLIAEFFGSEPVRKSATETEILQRSGEALFGIKYDVTTQFALHAGATVGVIDSPATPDWRLYAGINWNAGPIWKTATVRRERLPKKQVPAPVRRPAPSPVVAETPLAQPEPEARETFVLENILFATDSSVQVLQGAIDELKELVEHLKGIPEWKRLVVEGHTDSVGEDAYNLELSQRRADSIRAYLVKYLGIPSERITARGYGESRPIADNDNYQGRQQNRRVEIQIFD